MAYSLRVTKGIGFEICDNKGNILMIAEFGVKCPFSARKQKQTAERLLSEMKRANKH